MLKKKRKKKFASKIAPNTIPVMAPTKVLMNNNVLAVTRPIIENLYNSTLLRYRIENNNTVF